MLIQTVKTHIIRVTLFVAVVTLSFIALQLALDSKASAATITPDGTTCTLDEAVGAMNNGADENGCVATGAAYGTDDTIDIPSGTFGYSNTNGVDVSLTIQGAGMGETIVDLDNSNGGFYFTNLVTPQTGIIQDLTIIDPTNGSNHAINTTDYSMTIRRVEVYSTDANSGGVGITVNYLDDDLSSTIEDIYIHDISFNDSSPIAIYTQQGATSTSNIIRNVTIESVTITAVGGFGIVIGSVNGGGSIAGAIYNSTITNLDFANQGGYIASYADGTVGGTTVTNIDIYNNTVAPVQEITAASSIISGLGSIAIASPGNTASSTARVQNNIIVSTYSGSTELTSCIEAAVGAGGTETATFTSLGGNLTDDNTSCNAYFTETNDQTDVSNLASTLGSLQDNGGNVMTMALLEGSPAIDNGITNALSADQRGTSRPQGSAFDTGAFEFVVASEENTNGNNSSEASDDTTLANTGENTTLIYVIAIGTLTISGLYIRRLIYKRV